MSFRKVLWVFTLFVITCGYSYTLNHLLKQTNTNITNRSSTNDLEEESRKKKKDKFLLPVIFGALIVKSIVLPLAFKAMAVMSSVAVLLSTMSLIISSIIGYAKAGYKHPPPPALKVIHVNEGTWAKEDDSMKGYMPDGIDYDPSAAQESVYYPNKWLE